jgi:hypothetical protein
MPLLIATDGMSWTLTYGSGLQEPGIARIGVSQTDKATMMNQVRADVTNAFEDPTGVYFHVDTPERRMKVHILFGTLAELGSGQESGDFANFVQENEPAMQRLVNQNIENGWEGPLTLIT